MSGEKTRAAQGLTERQQKWFASVRASLEASTGRPLQDWVALARTCPETAPRKRKAWLKAEHGLGVNYASYVLAEAFPSDAPGWDDPDRLRALLWSEAGSRAILERLDAIADGTEGVAAGQRKTYTAWSRAVQFAAARPLKGGRARLGLKLDPDVSPRLSAPTRKESWSERLTGVVDLDGPHAVDDEIGRLFRAAAERG
jgi:hypothetical protein